MNDEDTKRKIEFFLENKTSIHIDTTSERFYNGLIIEVGTDFLIIQEKILGRTFILFSEIENIEPFLDKGDKNG